MTGRSIIPEVLMTKADVALSSANALLALDDVDGATNRAYYAMFDAARAALMVSGAPIDQDIGRTQSGLITAFGLHLVKSGTVDREMGRTLNRAHEVRLLADYTDRSVGLNDARQMVQGAERFFTAIRDAFFSVR
jgi:uncharacterized protein (UPF0332 family)